MYRALWQCKKKKKKKDFQCSSDILQATEESLLNFIDFFPSV